MPKAITKKDRLKEKYIADKLSARWGYEYKLTGDYSDTDIHFYKWKDGYDHLVAVAEVKAREVKHNKYPDGVYMNYSKLAKLTPLIPLRPPVIYAVGFKDGIYWANLSRNDLRKIVVVWKGRTDRVGMVNDETDVALIPVEWFKYVVKCGELWKI